GSPRVAPSTDCADASIVTAYAVAYGIFSRSAGVKMSVRVPDQRNVPGSFGLMWNQGTTTGSGMRPSTTIGWENTTRTSLASASEPISPWGPDWVTVNPSAARSGDAGRAQATSDATA